MPVAFPVKVHPSTGQRVVEPERGRVDVGMGVALVPPRETAAGGGAVTSIMLPGGVPSAAAGDRAVTSMSLMLP